MISGFFILNKEIKIDEFYKKRLLRIIKPLLFWIVIYLFFDYFILNKKLEFNDIIDYFLNKKASFHLWFVYSLISVYLIAPLIKESLIKNNKIGYYFIFISFLIFFFKHIITFTLGYKLGIDTQYFHYPLFYFILGYQISTIDFKKVKYIQLYALLLFIISTTISVYFVQKYSIESGKNKPFGNFYNSTHPLIIIASSSIFIFFKNLNIQLTTKSILYKIIESLSKYSYGIFLCHILIRTCIYRGYFGQFLNISEQNYNAFIFILYYNLLIFFLSYILTLIFSKLIKFKIY
jgi:surface polysaccharide O-acyltransferase-like enzyme